MIVAGTISKKMEPAVKTLYDQMPEPKWVIAMGNCAISGGPFVFDGQYGIVEGADKFLPVDIYLAGCPPRPDNLLHALMMIQDKIGKSKASQFKNITIDDDGIKVPELNVMQKN